MKQSQHRHGDTNTTAPVLLLLLLLLLQLMALEFLEMPLMSERPKRIQMRDQQGQI